MTPSCADVIASDATYTADAAAVVAGAADAVSADATYPTNTVVAADASMLLLMLQFSSS